MPFAVDDLIWYEVPALDVEGDVRSNVVAPDVVTESGGALVIVVAAPLIYAWVMFTVVLPVFCTNTSI